MTARDQHQPASSRAMAVLATVCRLCGTSHNRHTCAMDLLRSGVDIATIALWLGHATTKATSIYLHADLALKEQALARTAPRSIGRRRYRPGDTLLAFLEAL